MIAPGLDWLFGGPKRDLMLVPPKPEHVRGKAARRAANKRAAESRRRNRSR